MIYLRYERRKQRVKVLNTDSGLPMILATALVASLRMSEHVKAMTGMFVNRFKVGIFFFLFLQTKQELQNQWLSAVEVEITV